MPIYKGTTEVTSGNLYKATTEIENGYKGTDPFYINEITVSWATPTGQGLAYTQPSPQSSSGSPGAAFPSTTFTITGGSTIVLSGTATIAGLPTGLSAAGQSYNNTNPGNILTVTITGTFPVASSLNTALTISGLTSVTWYTATVDYSALVTATRSSSRSAYVGGAVNTTDNGSIWTGLVPTGANTLYVDYVVDQTGVNPAAVYDWRQRVTSDGTSNAGMALPVCSGVTFSSWSGFSNTNAEPQTTTTSSGAVTVPSDTTFTITAGTVYIFTKIWKVECPSATQNVSTSVGTQVTSFGLVSIVPTSDYPVGKEFNYAARTATMTSNNGAVAQSFIRYPGGGSTFASFYTASILANGYPGDGTPSQSQTVQVSISVAGTYTYTFTWGSATLQFTAVAT